MRWNQPERKHRCGDTRVVTRFLWTAMYLPHKDGVSRLERGGHHGELRQYEKARIEQVFCIDGRWANRCWAEGE